MHPLLALWIPEAITDLWSWALQLFPAHWQWLDRASVQSSLNIGRKLPTMVYLLTGSSILKPGCNGRWMYVITALMTLLVNAKNLSRHLSHHSCSTPLHRILCQFFRSLSLISLSCIPCSPGTRFRTTSFHSTSFHFMMSQLQDIRPGLCSHIHVHGGRETTGSLINHGSGMK